MTLRKLGILPDSAQYSVDEGNDAISVKLDGGASRYRLDVIGAAKDLTCRWSLDRAEYTYFRAFYNTYANYSADPFLIDLIIDDSVPEEHTAHFKPATLQLIEQRGFLYVVQAEIEAIPIPRTDGYYELIVALFDAYGATYASNFASMVSLLETLVNVTLPAI